MQDVTACRRDEEPFEPSARWREVAVAGRVSMDECMVSRMWAFLYAWPASRRECSRERPPVDGQRSVGLRLNRHPVDTLETNPPGERLDRWNLQRKDTGARPCAWRWLQAAAPVTTRNSRGGTSSGHISRQAGTQMVPPVSLPSRAVTSLLSERICTLGIGSLS